MQTLICLGEEHSTSDLSLLIVGGEDVDGKLEYETELICYPEKQKHQQSSFLSNNNSSVPDFPLPSSGLIGSVLLGVPLFCGGKDSYGNYVSTCTEFSQRGICIRDMLIIYEREQYFQSYFLQFVPRLTNLKYLK